MGAKREQRKMRASGWHSLASSGNQLALCCTASAGDSWPSRLGILMVSYPMFWHKAMPDGIGTQREELRGSHSPPSSIESMDLKPVVVPGSAHPSPSSPAAAPGLETWVSPNPVSVLPSILTLFPPLSFTPDLTLPSALARPSSPALTLPGPAAIVVLCPASRRRNSREAEWEDFLIKWGQNTAVIFLGQMLERRRNPEVCLLSEWRPLCDSAGEGGRIGVFIVGGDLNRKG